MIIGLFSYKSAVSVQINNLCQKTLILDAVELYNLFGLSVELFIEIILVHFWIFYFVQ